jgi:hypothetical protein
MSLEKSRILVIRILVIRILTRILVITILVVRIFMITNLAVRILRRIYKNIQSHDNE